MHKPEEIIKKVIEEAGGLAEYMTQVNKEVSEFNNIWGQDADKIGRVLRAHLVVEHFLTAHLEAANPNLGSIENARISYIQKIELLGDKDKSLTFLIPGLKRLNSIRNRLAHNLSMDVDAKDSEVFLSIKLFKAMREEGSKGFEPPPNDPLSVLEQFAKFAAGVFQASASPNSELWRRALEN